MANSPELAFLIGACKAAFSRHGELAAGDPHLDWALVVRLARFHRVQGLVHSGLNAAAIDVPRELEPLASDAASIAAANLRAAVECRDLLELFETAGLSLLFVKGLTLSALAYANSFVKAAVDLDLLVDEARLEDATRLLRDRGYLLIEPDASSDFSRLRKWHELRKESSWARPGFKVDLHTRLADNARLLPTVGLGSPAELVDVAGGIRLPTLAREELFAYLCVHGASSAWFRLKWITDFAALLHNCAPDEIARLYDRSQQLGAGRAAGQALLLADQLYATLGQSPDLKRHLTNDWVTAWLMGSALKQVAGRREPVEPTARPLGTLRIHFMQFLLLPGIAFKGSEFARQARAAAA